MFCINCFHIKTAVTNSRPQKNKAAIWRRRTCLNCGKVFTTYERPSLAENTTIYSADGTNASFNIGRLIISINQSFSHNQAAGKYDSLWLAQTVEDTLSSQIKTITTDDIAAITHQVLRAYDELAAVQYAARHELISSVRRRGRPSLASREPSNEQSPSR